MWRSVWLGVALLCCWATSGVGADASSTPANGYCPSCRAVRQDVRLKAIKEQILYKLGMKQAPNITGRHPPAMHIPPLEDLMQADQPSIDDGYDEFSATTERVIVFSQPHPKLRHDRGQDVLYFKFPEKVQEMPLLQAQLWLYLKGGGKENQPPVNITIFRLVRYPQNSEKASVQFVTSSVEARSGKGEGRWVRLNVLNVVSDWFVHPRKNLGLVVDVRVIGHETRSQHLICTSPHQEYRGDSHVPFLEVYAKEDRLQRRKRSTGLDCTERSTESRCCRYPLTVDFEEFGWEWVIAPKRYEAYFCSGDCPNDFLEKHSHTHLLHIATFPNSTLARCCAPRKFSPISMLYFNEQLNIIYDRVPSMVVDSCGCT